MYCLPHSVVFWIILFTIWPMNHFTCPHESGTCVYLSIDFLFPRRNEKKKQKPLTNRPIFHFQITIRMENTGHIFDCFNCSIDTNLLYTILCTFNNILFNWFMLVNCFICQWYYQWFTPFECRRCIKSLWNYKTFLPYRWILHGC